MPIFQLRNVNFGMNRANATGSAGVGYTVLDAAGSVVSPRTTLGVYQTAPGIYAAYIQFPDNFRGQVLWDTGTAFLTTSYATEQYNVEENDPRVASTWQMVNDLTGTIQSLYDVSYGRWKIDKAANQMIFYKADNVTEVARFNLFDDNGVPTFDGVFERQKV
jgi:hypothetical protein